MARSRSATTPEVAIEAYEQLAIYYEHHAREPMRAAELTQAAMEELRKASCAQNAHLDFDRSRRIRSRLDRRLARLARKAKSAGLSFNIPTT